MDCLKSSGYLGEGKAQGDNRQDRIQEGWGSETLDLAAEPRPHPAGGPVDRIQTIEASSPFPFS